ncbi:MAG: PAS domain S-box protein [Phycisphaerae bacterium]
MTTLNREDEQPAARPKRQGWLIASFWTAIIAASLLWNMHHQHLETQDMAVSGARICFEKDVLYRRWAADHGGVYAPITRDTPANPLLAHLPERDLTTPSGRKLTLINPAYMTRQVHELGEGEYGTKGHLTSLIPLRPENKPDAWETEALQAFARGATEVSSVEEMDGEAYMRLMRPLFVEQNCLQCHAQQGYELGDIRGGLAVAVPLAPIAAIAAVHTRQIAATHLGLWILGLVGLFIRTRYEDRCVRERLQAGEALRQSESQYRSLAKVCPVGIFRTDAEGNYRYVNTRWWLITGMTAEDALGEGWKRNLHEEDRERVLQAWSAAIAQGQPFQFEYRFVTPDGIVTWVYGQAIAELNDSCDIVGYVGTITDITERKSAEAEVRKLSIAVEQSPASVVITDTQGTIEYVNPMFCKVTGYAAKEAIGQNPRILKSGEWPTRSYKKMWDTILGGGIWTGEFHNKRKNGELYWETASITPVRNEAGEITHFLAIKQDITNRKRAELAAKEQAEELASANRALKASRERAESANEELTRGHTSLLQMHEETNQLLEAISSVLISVGADDRIKACNTTAQLVLGIEAKDAIGTRLEDLDVTWNWSTIKVAIADCRATHRPVRIEEIRFTRPDDTQGFLGITVNPVNGVHGKKGGFLITAADITEQKILQGQLAQSQKLESIGQLAAGIAHEINTPTQYVGDNTRFLKDSAADLIAIVDKYAELLASENGPKDWAQLSAEIKAAMDELDFEYLKEEVPKAIDQSLEGVERVATIVRSMKAFSHPGGNEKQMADLNKAIESTITVSRNEWKYVAEMVTEFDSALPLVPCLLGDINQVVLNMIVNAAHAIADVVGSNSSEKGTITVSTRRDGGWAEIRINDTGTGIPPEIVAKVFEPFFTTKEVGKGTGQGLAIARNVIVEKHGGTINVESEVGKGTTMIVRLPIQPESGDAKEAPVHEAANSIC